MRTKQFVLAIASVILCLQFCSCLTYYPNLIKTPMMHEKGEVHGAAFVANNSVDAYAAYAASDDIALMASGSMGFSNSANQTETHVFGEGAVGTFHSWTPRISTEAYVGAGFGQSYTLVSQDQATSQMGNYVRGFMSGDVSYSLGVADIGVAARLVGVDFVTGRDNFSGDSYGLFIEPAVFGRIGWDRLKLDGQIGTSRHIFSHPGFGTQQWFYGIGLHFILPSLM